MSTQNSSLYAVLGITGQVGGTIADLLLKAGQRVRAVVRSTEKGKLWQDKGCEIAVATVTDTDALTKAFTGVDGVFLMIPPDYDPAPGFPIIHEILAAVTTAVKATQPNKLVYLSTVGAQVTEPNLLNNAHIMESGLRSLPVPVAFLRAAWFMENASWDVAAAKQGVIPSFLQPLDHPIPMVAVADIGRTAVELLQETGTGTRIVELEGPRRYSANDIASTFSKVLGQSVRMEPVPHDTWESLFRSQGMKNPTPRIRMLDGFNEGWIDFEGESRKGSTPLETVLRQLISSSPHS